MINQKTFIVLDDVRFYNFQINGTVIPISRRIINNVNGLIQCLEKNVSRLIKLDGKTIASKINEAVDSRYFVITLDQQTYFRDSDFSFGLSRTVNTPTQILKDKYSVKGRLGQPTPKNQAQQIARKYKIDGNGRPIILCDDGIGTGSTLETAIETLREQKLKIHKLCVVVNPQEIEEISGVKVATLYQDNNNFNWLNSRDLIFGGPRSGVTYAPKNYNNRIFGVPYLIDRNMIQNRIGVFGEQADKFRDCCLKINIELWNEIEEAIVGNRNSIDIFHIVQYIVHVQLSFGGIQ